MELTDALAFASDKRQAVLVTLRKDGRPQLSNIMYHLDEAGTFRISITADRAKYHNLRRNPWAAVHVTRGDFYAYVVFDGEVELTEPAGDPNDATVEELVWYYEQAVGPHEDWDEYRRAMVDDRRVIARFRPSRAYGMVPLPAASD